MRTGKNSSRLRKQMVKRTKDRRDVALGVKKAKEVIPDMRSTRKTIIESFAGKNSGQLKKPRKKDKRSASKVTIDKLSKSKGFKDPLKGSVGRYLAMRDVANFDKRLPGLLKKDEKLVAEQIKNISLSEAVLKNKLREIKTLPKPKATKDTNTSIKNRNEFIKETYRYAKELDRILDDKNNTVNPVMFSGNIIKGEELTKRDLKNVDNLNKRVDRLSAEAMKKARKPLNKEKKLKNKLEKDIEKKKEKLVAENLKLQQYYDMIEGPEWDLKSDEFKQEVIRRVQELNKVNDMNSDEQQTLDATDLMKDIISWGNREKVPIWGGYVDPLISIINDAMASMTDTDLLNFVEQVRMNFGNIFKDSSHWEYSSDGTGQSIGYTAAIHELISIGRQFDDSFNPVVKTY